MNSHFNNSDVKILEQQIVYQGHFQIEQWKLQFRLFNGGWSQPRLREVFERGEAVGVLLFDANNDQLVLIEQFRVGIVNKTENPWLMEIVAGVIKKDENLEQVARRETQEESGLEITKLFPIYQYWVSPGGSSERMYLFCGQIDAKLARGIHGVAEEGEDIRLHVLSLKSAFDLLNQGKINNSSTIIALQWLQLNEQIVRAAFLKSE
ncbi:MAG: ADP-ribose pyrophosphatase [Pseudomonadota bacterium]|jgi:ADP-ribose pyrophosphatase